MLWFDYLQFAGLVGLLAFTAALHVYGWRLNRREQQQIQQANRERHSWVLWFLSRTRQQLESKPRGSRYLAVARKTS